MVDIATFRARIGLYSRGPKNLMDLDTLRVVGTFGFIGILLLIAGVELNPGPFDRDDLSTALLPEPWSNSHYAAKSTGNGNCLYNSCSLALCGDETMAPSLRHAVSKELQNNPSRYGQDHPLIQRVVQEQDDIVTLFQTVLSNPDDQHGTVTLENIPDLINTEGLKTLEDKRWSTILHVMALSTVLGRTVHSLYPEIPWNYRELYNNRIDPAGEQSFFSQQSCNASSKPILLFWTRDGDLSQTDHMFMANHVVPVFEITSTSDVDIISERKKTQQKMDSFLTNNPRSILTTCVNPPSQSSEPPVNESISIASRVTTKELIRTVPNQPKVFKFPQRVFGQKKPVKRSFQSAWFNTWPWLDYNESTDIVFCHVCKSAFQEGKILSSKIDKSFILNGYSNWKDASVSFKKHESSICHHDSVEVVVTLPKTTSDIADMLSIEHAEAKRTNRECLKKVLTSLKFLCRQGLAIRGDGDGSDSNFMQLLTLRSEDDTHLVNWIKRKNDKYMCADSQNEMLQIMALSLLRDIAQEIRNSKFFSIMADETTDMSNREQFVLVIRHVDKELIAREEFIGLYKVDTIDSYTLKSTIEDCLLRMNLSINNCRGQCYDGASNMSGAKNGVAKQISDKEPKAVYTHCYGHALNLAVSDTIKQSKIMRDALDTTYEISKLVKYSPKRDSMFEKLKQELAPETPGFRTLCPTRWTVKANSLQSVVDNYEVLQNLWEDSFLVTKDTEIRARIKGVDAQMKSFGFLFGVMLGQSVLRYTDNLSKGLQHKDLSALEGRAMAMMTIDTLKTLRNEETYNQFFEDVKKKAENLDVNEPIVPRKRKVAKKIQLGDAEHYFPQTVNEFYRHKYFEALDLTIQCVYDRFDQPGLKVLRNIEELIVKAVQHNYEMYSAEFMFVTEFYSNDINKDSLKVQLEILRAHFTKHNNGLIRLEDVLDYFRNLQPTLRAIYSEVETLFRIILTMPATNATSERTFSALRRIKTYLRTTMSQTRLNNLMTLHVHKKKTDALDPTKIAEEFVARVERRRCVFGNF